jgi:hypothetical protein
LGVRVFARENDQELKAEAEIATDGYLSALAPCLVAYAAFSTLAAPGLPPVKGIYSITVAVSSSRMNH